MVDARDLKSLETMSRASSSLAPGTRKQGVTVLLAVTPFTFYGSYFTLSILPPIWNHYPQLKTIAVPRASMLFKYN